MAELNRWTWGTSIFYVHISNSIKLPNYCPPYSHKKREYKRLNTKTLVKRGKDYFHNVVFKEMICFQSLQELQTCYLGGLDLGQV